MSDDSAAISRIVSGDLRGLGDLYDRHAAILHAFVRRFASPEDSEDVVQATFLRVLEKAPSFEQSRSSAKPWIFGISVQVLRERRRAFGRIGRILSALSDTVVSHRNALFEAQHDLKRGFAGSDESGLAGGRRAQEHDHAVACPNLRVAGCQRGGTKTVRSRAAMKNISRPLPGIVDQRIGHRGSLGSGLPVAWRGM